MFRIWTSVSHVSNDFAYSKFVVCCELLMKSATLNRARCQRLFWCLFQGLGRGLTTNRAWWQRLWWSFLSGLTGGSAPWGTRPGAKILLPDSSMRILSSTAGSFKTTVTVCPSLSISVSSSFTTFSFLFFFFFFFSTLMTSCGTSSSSILGSRSLGSGSSARLTIVEELAGFPVLVSCCSWDGIGEAIQLKSANIDRGLNQMKLDNSAQLSASKEHSNNLTLGGTGCTSNLTGIGRRCWCFGGRHRWWNAQPQKRAKHPLNQ